MGLSFAAPLAGRDCRAAAAHLARGHFNPRAPCGARLRSCAGSTNLPYFNPRTPCGARLGLVSKTVITAEISIHAPLAGCDLKQSTMVLDAVVFQSTHPLRGATVKTGGLRHPLPISIHAPLAGCDFAQARSTRPAHNFNPRTPCGVRPKEDNHEDLHIRISIHAPLAGCDYQYHNNIYSSLISIHAPLAGCDRDS